MSQTEKYGFIHNTYVFSSTSTLYPY